MNRLSKILFSGVISLLVLPISVYAIPDKPPVDGNVGLSSTALNISYKGDTEFKSDTEEKSTKYNSTSFNENSILVSSGNISLVNPTVTKSGDSEGDKADF